MAEEDKGQASSFVKDASLIPMCSFLPASWTGDAHEETDFLPIGNQEEKEERLLNRLTDSSETIQVLVAKYLWMRVFRGETRRLDC